MKVNTPGQHKSKYWGNYKSKSNLDKSKWTKPSCDISPAFTHPIKIYIC